MRERNFPELGSLTRPSATLSRWERARAKTDRVTVAKDTPFRARCCAMRTIVLLTISNVFMTFAWYGHLKFRESRLWKSIVISWLIASVEYCFQVPANRIGSYQYSTAQLKTIQEVITLVGFAVFSLTYLGESLKWNHAVAFLFIVGAVFFMFLQNA